MSNLLKCSWIEIKDEDKRVIDTNELVRRKLGNAGLQTKTDNEIRRGEPDENGFSSGFNAKILDGLTDENGLSDDNIIKGQPVNEGPSYEELRMEAERMMQEAREQIERAKQEAEQITSLAKDAALILRNEARQEGLQQGYEEGLCNARQEAAQKMAQLQEREEQLQAAYEQKIQELEPLFIDNLTSIYEQIFHVELRDYREILSYLIAATMRKAEGNRDFYIHVSKEDYPFISMQKKQLAAAATAANSLVEVVEDLTLSKNQCMIETEGGIFDCGVDTQLTELTNRLRLLSYERTE